MKLNLEEQERIDTLRYFLRDWGKYIIGLIAVIIIAYVADSLWNWYQVRDSAKAAILYQSFSAEAKNNNTPKVYAIANTMENSYPTNEYTAMASMMAAKIAKDKSENTPAEKYLKFVINNSKNNGLVDVARLRLADVYIDEHKFNLVVPLLMEKHDKSFDALYYSKRGDLHLAKGELNQAREAYKAALKMAGDNQSVAEVIQMRLDVLGN